MLALLSLLISCQAAHGSTKLFKPVNKTHMEVLFQLPPKSTEGKLNGFYSLHHDSCEDTICGGGQFETPHIDREKLQILASLSPCSDQPGIVVKLHTWTEGLSKTSKPMNYVAELPCTQKSFKPLNTTHMEVKFMLPPAAQQGNKLNGTYSIHHTSCPASLCGGGHFLTPQKDKQRLHIATNLSPCSSYHNITVKLYSVDGMVKKSKPMSYRALSLSDIHLCNSCNEDSTPGLSEELAGDRWCKVVRRIDGSQVHFPDEKSSSSLTSDENSSLTSHGNSSLTSSDEVIAFFAGNNYQNAIIIGCCSVALILAIVVTCCLVKRKKRNRSYDLTN